ncbi:MAG: dihydrodipicolinate synthase family protein [Actinomycetota bacterium]
MSAILLPHLDAHTVDWDGFAAHVTRTRDAGLTPAVNMDTGFVQLLDRSTKLRVLDQTAEITGGAFVAGAFVSDDEGAEFDLGAYVIASTEIAERGGTPVVFPSHGLNGTGDDGWLAGYRAIAGEIDRFIGFELGTMFVPYGRIVALDTYRALLEIPQCVGAKHSSLDRQLEWDRLAIRDEVRPDFMVLTGNDLAIDMVRYGSDYLLGLSTFAPDLFARRDVLWAAEDPAYHELDDLLQYLGQFAFRSPVPGYRHDAAMVMKVRGWIGSDAVPHGAPLRPESDRDVLAGIVERMERWA